MALTAAGLTALMATGTRHNGMRGCGSQNVGSAGSSSARVVRSGAGLHWNREESVMLANAGTAIAVLTKAGAMIAA